MIEWLNSSSWKEHLVVKMTLVGNAGSLAPTHSTMESSKKCSCVVVPPPVLWLLPRQHPISRLSQVLQFLLTWLYNFLSVNSFPTKIIITSCNYWTIESHAIESFVSRFWGFHPHMLHSFPGLPSNGWSFPRILLPQSHPHQLHTFLTVLNGGLGCSLGVLLSFSWVP